MPRSIDLGCFYFADESGGQIINWLPQMRHRPVNMPVIGGQHADQPSRCIDKRSRLYRSHVRAQQHTPRIAGAEDWISSDVRDHHARPFSHYSAAGTVILEPYGLEITQELFVKTRLRHDPQNAIRRIEHLYIAEVRQRLPRLRTAEGTPCARCFASSDKS